MKKFAQMPYDLYRALNSVKEDEDMASLGFSCTGFHLCDYKPFEEFGERLWVWTKVVDNLIYIAITVDEGNGFCSVIYKDMYIEEVIHAVMAEDN